MAYQSIGVTSGGPRPSFFKLNCVVQNVARRVDVAVVDCTANTLPVADFERHFSLFMSANRANFAAGKEPFNLLNYAPKLLGFVEYLACELIKTYIADGLRQSMIFYHIFNRQILNRNDPKSLNQFRSNLM